MFGRKHRPLTPPSGLGRDSIMIESSICTGEKTIGFYDASNKRLLCAELVTDDKDIADFYVKYGFDAPSDTNP